MLGNMVTNMMVEPYQSPLFDSPEAWGLDHENVEFRAMDGTKLKGWLIKGGTKVTQHEVARGLYLWFWNSNWIEPAYAKTSAVLKARIEAQ